jgi:AraC-like DNA-binding protein
VLDLATSDAGQLRLNNGFIELGQVLRIAADSGRQMAADKGLTWEVDLPESGPWIWGDATRLRQVALNLIGNAVKYTERGGVSMRLQVGPDVAVVIVSDTGLGIARDEQEAIFDEFHRAERTVNQGYAGMGLGLSISKRLVEMHGGSIGVRSSGENGAGSAFYFSLPIIQPSEISANQRAEPKEGKQCMWVVTTRPAFSAGFCERLRARGFEVHVIAAESLPDWQSGQTEPQPDAILLDVQLASDLSGRVLTALKQSQLTREAPVLFYELSAERGAVMELDFLTKPIGPAEMIQALDEQWLVQDADTPEKTVLIVDDDPQTVDMHARMVQSHSARHRIRKAHNGQEALAVLRQERVDLVLLDLSMPEPDGFAVLDAMRAAELNRYTPVIVVTGQTLTQPAMQRLTQGVATVLSKGMFSVDETLSHVEAALGRQRKRGSQAQRLARQAMAYIHEHYAEQITRESLARHLAVNEDYLTLCFRKEMGMTPIAYLNRYRVNQAKGLLTNSAQSITEIAMAVGFSDSGYFSRVFRQKAGMSPEAYRQSPGLKSF